MLRHARTLAAIPPSVIPDIIQTKQLFKQDDAQQSNLRIKANLAMLSSTAYFITHPDVQIDPTLPLPEGHYRQEAASV